MITFNNIVNRFETFVAEHALLKTFSFGSPANVDLEKFGLYPLLHLVYSGANYDVQQKTYNFEVYILDLPPSIKDKFEYQRELISASEQVAEDLIADLQSGGRVFKFDYEYVLQSATTTPLEETTSNVLAGSLLDIAITVGFDAESCNSPLI